MKGNEKNTKISVDIWKYIDKNKTYILGMTKMYSFFIYVFIYSYFELGFPKESPVVQTIETVYLNILFNIY